MRCVSKALNIIKSRIFIFVVDKLFWNPVQEPRLPLANYVESANGSGGTYCTGRNPCTPPRVSRMVGRCTPCVTRDKG